MYLMNYLLPVQVGAIDMARFIMKQFQLWNKNSKLFLSYHSSYFIILTNLFSPNPYCVFHPLNTLNVSRTKTICESTKMNKSTIELDDKENKNLLLENTNIHNNKIKDLLLNNTNNSINSNLASYVAGLFEGDGHISFQIYKPTNKVSSATLGITFNIKELMLCEHLQSKLGGKIRLKTEYNACDLLFTNRTSLIKIVQLVSSHLRSPKIIKFNALIEYLNRKDNLNIKPANLDDSDLSSNSWLKFAGFIDADGCFMIGYTTKTKFRIRCTLSIEQRMIDPYSNLSYEPLFLKISTFLNTKLRKSIHNKDKTYYLIQANTRSNIKIIIDYFSKFSLYSSKHLNYLDWRAAGKALLDKTAYLPENKVKILEHKNNMNRKRTFFNWDHLKGLY
jgi:hypothetical protein